MESNESRFEKHVFCPFHEDTEASLAIYSNGTYFCWGCRAYGNVEDLDASTLRTNKEQKICATSKRAEIRSLYGEMANASDSLWFDSNQINKELYTYFSNQLFTSGRYKYFVGRKLSVRVIRQYLLGWTGTRYSFPIFRYGKPYSLSLRRSEDDKKNSFKYFNLADTNATLYNESKVYNSKSAIITEGIMDCLSLAQFDFPTVCSTSGASGFNRDWAKTTLHKKEVYIILDNDRGGKLGRELLTEYFNGKCKQIYIPEKFNDVNEFLMSTNTQTFSQYIRNEVEKCK